MARTGQGLFTAALAAACFAAGGAPTDPNAAMTPGEVEYRSMETRLLEGDLVRFLVEMRGGRGAADVQAFGDCAAAQYALIRGYGFARHVRTTVKQQSGLWQGDAIYTISPAIPRGTRTIDAEVTVANCQEQGIPTV